MPWSWFRDNQTAQPPSRGLKGAFTHAKKRLSFGRGADCRRGPLGDCRQSSRARARRHDGTEDHGGPDRYGARARRRQNGRAPQADGPVRGGGRGGTGCGFARSGDAAGGLSRSALDDGGGTAEHARLAGGGGRDGGPRPGADRRPLCRGGHAPAPGQTGGSVAAGVQGSPGRGGRQEADDSDGLHVPQQPGLSVLLSRGPRRLARRGVRGPCGDEQEGPRQPAAPLGRVLRRLDV